MSPMFPVYGVTYVPGLYRELANIQLEPTRLTVCVIMRPRRAAQLHR